MIQGTTIAETEFATLSASDMRNINGLTRRNTAGGLSIEEGGSREDLEYERMQISTQTVASSVPLPYNKFREVLLAIGGLSATVFALALMFTAYLTIRAGVALHNNAGVGNFFYFWGSNTLLIICIMGLLHASKLHTP